MSEYIGIKGVLEGIKDMLGYTDKDTLELLRTKMDCSKAMLGGVIKELEPPKELVIDGKKLPDEGLDREAIKAKEELE